MSNVCDVLISVQMNLFINQWVERQKEKINITSQILNLNNIATGHNTQYKTVGVHWLFELRFPHQSPLYLDSEAAPKSPTFHTAKRYGQINKPK